MESKNIIGQTSAQPSQDEPIKDSPTPRGPGQAGPQKRPPLPLADVPPEEYLPPHPTDAPRKPTRKPLSANAPLSLLDRFITGERAAALTFAGQGIPYLAELRQLERQSTPARILIHEASEVLQETISAPLFRRSGYYTRGFELLRWLRDENSAPDQAYLSSSMISQSLLFLTQVARYVALYDGGLSLAFDCGAIRAATGHSQGIMPALLVAESPNGRIQNSRALEMVRYYVYQGLHMQDSFGGLERKSGEATPMAAIARLDLSRLEATVKHLNKRLPASEQLFITLHNTRTRFVVSGAGRSLEALRQVLTEQGDREKKARSRGHFAGAMTAFDWEYLPVSGPFHSPYMAEGLKAMRESARALNFTLDASRLQFPVLSPTDGHFYNTEPDLTEALLVFQFLEPVRWEKTLHTLTDLKGVTDVLDLGPGDAVSKLSAVNLRGTGLRVLPVALPLGQKVLFGDDPAEPELSYDSFRPRLARLPDGKLRIDNRFTRFTGMPPVILPGMTPTTVEAPIVAAAANGGFMAELAGGGQVTEAILRERMLELRETLEPGREVVFNALFLDPYLWGLHFRQKGLVPKLKQEGAPLCGVTVSAGIPEVEEATALLNELEAAGLWLNTFKPGTLPQIDAVLKIAAANPQRTLLIQIEGGKAGGHHSWEDLDHLLLERYHRIRQQSNLILCVGGGIGTPERAVDYLSGQWSTRYAQRPMPVDAVFPGTVTMACLEAKTSSKVKEALVKAAGSERWVFTDEVDGGVTSGKSSLNADIHYIENAAARAGRLLDSLAGDAAAIEARREEIISTLNATAKPYFGDLHEMTYAAVLERLIHLMAIGTGSRYEDGVWPDRSYRERVADFFRRAEARLAGQTLDEEGGSIPASGTASSTFESKLTSLDLLDQPLQLVSLLTEHYPTALTQRLHPLDVRYFIHQLCRRPGKPVNFVPVIDAQVRGWYKSDSLWQSHDERFEADQVLIIPGPEALRGITRADEPVAELLGRFEQALIQHLAKAGEKPLLLKSLTGPRLPLPLPSGLREVSRTDTLITFELTATVATHQLLQTLGTRLEGPIARALLHSELLEVSHDAGQRTWKRRKNPLYQLLAGLPGTQIEAQRDPAGPLSTLRFSIPAGKHRETVVVSRAQGCTDLSCPLTISLSPRLAATASTDVGPLSFELLIAINEGQEQLTLDRQAFASRLRTFYHRALFGGELSAVELFESATCQTRIAQSDARAYGAITGGLSSTLEMPRNLGFTLAWEPLFRVLSHDTLVGGLLQLVHLSNRFTPGEAWPLQAGDAVDVSARLIRLEDRPQGRTIVTRAELFHNARLALSIESSFFIRDSFADSPIRLRALEPFCKELVLDDAAAVDFLCSHSWLRLDADTNLNPGDCLRIEGRLEESRPTKGRARVGATLTITRKSNASHQASGDVSWTRIGSILLDETTESSQHPVRAALDVLSPALEASQSTPTRTLARSSVFTPLELETFAEVGRDGNPIHVSPLMARMAGLEAPIVHGMWTSAAAFSFLVDAVAEGNPGRIGKYDAEFLAPALRGEPLEFSVARVGVRSGRLELELSAHIQRGSARIQVLRARAELLPPRTAYVFPGQGIQQPNMGMDGYARSSAARAIWDRADAFCRLQLGFPLLRIVRENPRDLVVNGETLHHEQGVLHLTQFTQVSMAVLANAQVAELRESGVMIDDAVTCGHSVGEYNAIGALAGVLPLETVIHMVYQRGCTMHRLVARDEHGESGFRMGVVRPHVAGLDEAGAEALVRQVGTETGLPIQIVNYNIRGRQYSVTGRIEALKRLETLLAERTPKGSKGAWVEVPGIDTPFHSFLLHNGVADFRSAMDARFPQDIPYERLLGRYIPNLVPRAFSLDREFIQEVYDYTKSEVLAEVLADFGTWSKTPVRLARTFLIELLAWQFASPVRWVETQELMFKPKTQGGLGVERLIEIGVGYQPTLANMARASLTDLQKGSLRGLAPIQVFNVEAERDTVFALDADAPVLESTPEVAPTQAAVVSQPIPAAVPVAQPVVTSGGASAAPVTDSPVTVEESLKVLLALQARVRVDQLSATETIDQLFDGVSSRRNQVLMDLGAEFNLGAIDGAHEKPISALAAELTARAKGWQAPGKYTRGAQDELVSRVFARAGMGRRDILASLEKSWGLGTGMSNGVLNTLTLATRAGASGRGGALGELGDAAPTNRAEAEALIDKAVALFGAARGLNLTRAGAAAGAGGGVVDSAAVQALADQLLGSNGVLMKTARTLSSTLAAELGHPLEPTPLELDGSTAADEAALKLLRAEHGPEFEKLVAPKFNARRHVAFTSARATIPRDIARLYFDGRNPKHSSLTPEKLRQEGLRLASHVDARTKATAAWYASRARLEGLEPLAQTLDFISTSTGSQHAPALFTPTRPKRVSRAGGSLEAREVPVESPDGRAETAMAHFISALTADADNPAVSFSTHRGPDTHLLELLAQGTRQALDFKGRTALVTGAGPGSIALEVVRHLLRGGARVVLTTSTYGRERLRFYRRLYRAAAVPGAELHVVPFNQASMQDVEALITWMFETITEQVGASSKVLKRPFVPDLVLPFGAIGELATLDQLSGRSEVTLRALLLAVERLIGAITTRFKKDGAPATPCHIVLPLSPNHGGFGGDGAYAESKAALEVLLNKWHSEREAWGRYTTLCATRIGWVRSTGLMSANDQVAAPLEAQTGVRTFNTGEMGYLIAGLCTDTARSLARTGPLEADLTGGFNRIPDLKGTVDGIRRELEVEASRQRRLQGMLSREAGLLGSQKVERTKLTPLPLWPLAPVGAASRTLERAGNPARQTTETAPGTGRTTQQALLARTVVIVGSAEVGPWGTARSRFQVEPGDALSPAGVLELAWMTGLVTFEDNERGGQWIDRASGEPVEETEIFERYHDSVRTRAGIRFLEPDIAGFDPEALTVLAPVFLEQDFSFRVASEGEARAFLRRDPQHTRIESDPARGDWQVTRLKGAQIHVPRQNRLNRNVAGQVPTGLDFTRFGIPQDMVDNIDRLTLFNLVATVDAFLSSGFTPEELLSRVHPARVANTQGAGIGGMRSLQRLYTDHLIGKTRQSDILQETLINVIAGYVVQSYVGSYGSMSHPVGACATAAVSVEEAYDKILAGKADFVVAGGFDDIGIEGAIGFHDMNATADTDDMRAMGLEPSEMSRPNDVRRRGFVEGQGGGTLLITRGDLALELGLPVLGVVGYAGSFADGIQKSVPAPGMGILAAAVGGSRSPLATALNQYGLSADDIALVYKHDTSTGANDPNENALHHQIQQALGRTPGNPLFVVSQKSLTGHSKGGAAAWQLNGLIQALDTGVIPGNRNLDSLDPVMERYAHLAFTDETLRPGPGLLKAGVATSLGFGHVGAIVLVLHRSCFEALLSDADLLDWRQKTDARRRQAIETWTGVMLGTQLAYSKRSHRRFAAPDGSEAQMQEEIRLLTDDAARLDLFSGIFTSPDHNSGHA